MTDDCARWGRAYGDGDIGVTFRRMLVGGEYSDLDCRFMYMFITMLLSKMKDS